MAQQGQEQQDWQDADAGARDFLGDPLPSTGDDVRDRKIALLFQALAQSNGVLTTACLLSGVPNRTVYNWRKEYEWINERIEFFQTDFRGDFLENQLFTLCKLGAEKSIHFALQNKKLAKYGYAEDTRGSANARELTAAQVDLLKQAGFDVVDDEQSKATSPGRFGNLALPAPQRPNAVH